MQGDNVAKKRVFLPVAVNLTVQGYGFEASKDVKYDIPTLGLRDIRLLSGPAASPVSVVASPRGSFAGWIDLPSIIRAPGVYSIRVHQNPEAEIIITIGVPPPFTVRVVAGAAKFADLPLDIWVLAFYGGSVARQDQVTSVSLAVYLRVGDETRVFTPATTVAIPGQAVFYARFAAPAEALGRDLLVVATVRAKFSPIAAEDTASDVTSVAIPPARLSDLIAAITTGVDVFNSALEQLTAMSSKLDTLSTDLGTAVTTIRGDIAAVRSDIAGVVALLLEVNTNVGLIAQAVLTVADQNNAILARLGDMDAKLTGVSSGVAKLSTDVAGLATLIRSANLSIARVVTDQAGRVVAALSDSEGRIVGAISTNAKTLSDLITASEGRVRGDVKAVSDALAAFQSGAFSKLDAIASSVDTVRADVSRLRTDATATANVVVGIQTAVNKIDTNVGGLVDTAKTIATTVDSINKAVPGLATKADVSGAQTAITGAIDKAKSDLQSAVKSAEDAASTSSRNWGVINAILIFIAIAVLAYSTFVARRA
jgi:methyl-accepting chemotaxis protein